MGRKKKPTDVVLMTPEQAVMWKRISWLVAAKRVRPLIRKLTRSRSKGTPFETIRDT